jgi:hypothetical protein
VLLVAFTDPASSGGAMKIWMLTVMLAACASNPDVQPIGDANHSIKVVSLIACIPSTRPDAYKAAAELCGARHEVAVVMGFDDDYGSVLGGCSTTVLFSCSARWGTGR